MGKRIAAMLISLCMIMTFVPTVLAADTIVSENTTWTEAATLTGNLRVEEGVTLTLGAQVTVSGAVTISGGGTIQRGSGLDKHMIVVSNQSTLTLDGITIDGGYKEDGTGLSAVQAMIGVKSGAKLIVQNETVLQNNNNTYGSGVAFGGAVLVEEGGTFEMAGGLIQNNIAKVGGGVDSYGTFTMTGGEISHNTASNGPGGGICSRKTPFTATNAVISYNTSNNAGGGVQSNPGLTMTDCIVQGNSASLGGGIYVQDAGKNTNGEITITATVTDCTISDNTATGKYGGGVWCNAKFVMNGGEISGNRSTNQGGGVYGGGIFEIAGKISNNESNAGGGVYVYSQEGKIGGSCTIKEGAEISGNTARSSSGGGIVAWSDNCNVELIIEEGSKITGNTAAADAGGVYVYGKLSMDGGEITNNTVGDTKIDLFNDGSPEENISITGGTFTSNPSANLAEGYGAKLVDGIYELGLLAEGYGVTKIGDTYYATLEDAIAAVQDGETIVLQFKAEHTGTITLNDGRTIRIDLNGNDIAFTPSAGMTQSGFVLGRATLELTGAGTVYETAPYLSPIVVFGASQDQEAYSVLHVGKDVTLRGWSGVMINGNTLPDGSRAAYGTQITVEGTVESVLDTTGAGGHGVYINGEVNHTDGNVPEITLTETSNVTSFGNGIYAAGYANWNLAGNITGTDSLSIKSGTFHITGGTYTATGEFADPAQANGNGSENTGAALSVTSNRSYAQKTDITVTGGVFISEHGYAFYEGIAQKDGVPAADASYAVLAVSGGTFTGNSAVGAVAINEAAEKEVITGGAFSSDVGSYIPGTHDEAMVSAGSFTVGQYNDSNVEDLSGAASEMAVRRTLASGANAYYPTLADALANESSTITLLGDNAEPIQISSPVIIYKNGYTAEGLEAAAGLSMIESDDSYTFYSVSEPEAGSTYSIQFQLEKLDGTGYENAGEAITGVAAEEVDAAIREAAAAYTGYSIGSVKLEGTAYTVQLNRNIYTIVFESAGTVVSQQSIKFGAAIEAPAEEPQRDRYRFMGWDGYTEGMTAQANATFAAQWIRITSGGSGGTKSYPVTVQNAANGKVTSSNARSVPNGTVTLTVTPDEGYELDTLTVTDANDDTVRLTEKSNGTYIFSMPARAVTVNAAFREAEPSTQPTEPPEPTEEGLPFTDVSEEDWFYDAVAFVYDNGLMEGTSDTAFSPELITTRGMIVTILYNLEDNPAVPGESVFSDVADGQFYTDAVEWAAANNIVNGFGDGTFDPNATITREQLAVIAYRYAAFKGYDVTASADLSSYADAYQIGEWAKTAFGWANANKLIMGISPTLLSPDGYATRAQVAAIMMRFCEEVSK